ncbi:MAG: hypothetical protein IKK57_05605 [Clostridia bacterium]|nr:hypothetical protein [Clostridia bacterium]
MSKKWSKKIKSALIVLLTVLPILGLLGAVHHGYRSYMFGEIDIGNVMRIAQLVDDICHYHEHLPAVDGFFCAEGDINGYIVYTYHNTDNDWANVYIKRDGAVSESLSPELSITGSYNRISNSQEASAYSTTHPCTSHFVITHPQQMYMIEFVDFNASGSEQDLIGFLENLALQLNTDN